MVERRFCAVPGETQQQIGGSDGTTLVAMVSYAIQRTRRPLWHLRGNKIKAHFLLCLLSDRDELFQGFERVTWMRDIKKNKELFM